MLQLQFFNISLEIIGSFLSIILFITQFMYIKTSSKCDRNFLYVLAINAMVLISDATAWGLKGHLDDSAILIVHVANFCVFLFSYLLLLMYSVYVNSYIMRYRTISQLPLTIIKILCILAISLLILSLWNHMYYQIDNQNMYHRQSLFWLSQIWGVIVMIINIAIITHNFKYLDKKEASSLLLYNFLPVIAMIIQSFLYGIALLHLTTTFCILIMFLSIQMNQIRFQKEQEMEIEKGKTAIILSQIQPHFLFNCLTSISHLCDVDPKQAKQAIRSFSDYLRGNLNTLTNENLIPFCDELHHIALYLSLENMRYEDDIKIDYDIQTSEFNIPPLVLQILVENAVIHGLLPKEEGGRITIKTYEDEQIHILVSDTGVGFNIQNWKANKHHIGLQNAKQRIELISHGTLSIKSDENKGTTVEITIPK